MMYMPMDLPCPITEKNDNPEPHLIHHTNASCKRPRSHPRPLNIATTVRRYIDHLADHPTLPTSLQVSPCPSVSGFLPGPSPNDLLHPNRPQGFQWGLEQSIAGRHALRLKLLRLWPDENLGMRLSILPWVLRRLWVSWEKGFSSTALCSRSLLAMPEGVVER